MDSEASEDADDSMEPEPVDATQGTPAPVEQAADLLPLVYDELRRLAAARLAREEPGQTLQATALVHEAWLRVAASPEQPWTGKAHFFGAAAEAMRRILIEKARRKLAQKRGGAPERVAPEEVEIAAPVPEERLLVVDEALDQLSGKDPEAAQLVKLRFFVGLSHREAAEVLGLSHASADRTWVFAKAWLGRALKES
jgi:RNA polymerase sigma factor (TIGR02999 family)